MSSPNPNEVWQVDVGGQVYEAPFGELSVWIGEGSLHPDDKVRKGNLRWIEAKRVPSLVPFFNAKAQGLPMPVMVTTTEAEPADAAVVVDSSATVNAATVEVAASPVELAVPDPVDHSLAVTTEVQMSAAFDPHHCALHPQLDTVFLCDGCGNGYCKTCPKSYGGSVKICPLCGAMCRALAEVVQKRETTEHRTTAVSQGFGSSDFFNALGHPFKFKTSLFFGALMFMGFMIGQGVSSLGGVYMMVSSIFCMMLANMLTFGVLANTTEHFSQGDLEANFMPSFENFELWDDVIHPFFLSIGAYLISFGPFFLVMIIGMYMVVSQVNSQMETFHENVEKIPGTHYYDAKRTVDQSNQVKSVLGDFEKRQEERLSQLDQYEEEAGTAEEPGVVEDQSARETREQEELWAMAQQSRKQSLESVIGKAPDTQAQENAAMIQSFLGLAAPFVVIGAIFFLWGLFYFPAACTVASYTRSFSTTMNPVVGLDTIKRMGGAYASLLFMGLVLGIASLIVSGIAAAILSPFDLPMFGNIPARAIGGMFTFYLWVVFSCLVGYAMFKKSDKLALN
jgi:hypothetical protein